MIDVADLRTLAGQRLMLGFDGTTFNGDLETLIRELNPGGIILFSRNIETPDQVRALCRDVQEYARSLGLPPLFIAIDQEGGAVARLRAPHFREFPGAPALHTEAAAARFGVEMAALLRSLGINMNMAPVLDVAPAGFPSIMGNRILGRDPERVARLGAAIIRAHQDQGVLAVAKHFPGIGRTTLDSHLDLPELDADLEDLAAYDLIPFQAATAACASGIMISHIRYTGIDADWPASLSQIIVRGLLRDRMGFDGLILTDDLDMGAISRHYEISDVMGRILAADADLALICHKSPRIGQAVDAIRRHLDQDAELLLRHEKSLARIMKFKTTELSGKNGAGFSRAVTV